ncbi:hypothetical protein H4R21_001804 [Coemansia helicoidea]|uniref:Uncharacterized protein n=1 Tax=Coemansia helicoidea TaxID=1286919 RepID=A0ACC1LAV3_9FUNG|nr:hypothetical protein H4R21_001804 [Coemansia helicoidea]
MDAITARYGGYYFGFGTKQCSPWSVLKFLERLAAGDAIEHAAAPHWIATGNTAGIAQLMRRHREEILQLAPHLLHDYYAKAGEGTIRVAGKEGKNECILSGDGYRRAYIGATTYPRSCTHLRGTCQIATLLLHLGFLTMGPGSALRIPNGEIQGVWEDANANALFGVATKGERDASRARLVDQLFDGDVIGISVIMRSAAMFVAHPDTMSHMGLLTFAKVLRSSLGAVFGRDATVATADESESGAGMLGAVITFNPMRRNRDRLHVAIEMVPIRDSDTKALALSMAKVRALALKGLDQVAEKGCVRCHELQPLQLMLSWRLVIEMRAVWWTIGQA